jgi:hypothetical protein
VWQLRIPALYCTAQQGVAGPGQHSEIQEKAKYKNCYRQNIFLSSTKSVMHRSSSGILSCLAKKSFFKEDKYFFFLVTRCKQDLEKWLTRSYTVLHLKICTVHVEQKGRNRYGSTTLTTMTTGYVKESYKIIILLDDKITFFVIVSDEKAAMPDQHSFSIVFL